MPLITFFTGIAFCYYAAAFDIYTGMLGSGYSGIHRGSLPDFKHIPALSLLLSSLVIFFLFQYVKELFFRYPEVYLLYFTGDVENNGFEPLTPCVQGRCSSQLS